MDEQTNKEAENDNPIGRLVFAVLIFIGLWYGIGYYTESKYANDAVEQYEIIERSGDKIAACRQIEYVIAAYLSNKDEKNFNKWKQKKADECN